MTTGTRPQIQRSDYDDKSRFLDVLNDIFSTAFQRIDALERLDEIEVLQELQFRTQGTLSPTSAPFAAAGLQVSAPFTPVGVLVLQLRVIPTALPGVGVSVITTPVDIKWTLRSPTVFSLDFITGLTINTTYGLRLGVIRAK